MAFAAVGRFFGGAPGDGRYGGSLFLRSLERSDRIIHAMISRGYDGGRPGN
jgi:energy-coupling factor transporter transmembrane protein EcfT